MRVLIASDVYPPEPRGGARHFQLLAKHLNQRGHSVAVCTTAFPGYAGYTEENGLPVYRINGLFSRIPFLYQVEAGRFPPPLSDWLVSRELRTVIKRHEPDVVHAQGWIIHSLLSALGEDNIPLVMSLLDYRAICPAAGMIPDAGSCDMTLSPRCVICSRALYGSGPLGTAKSLATYIKTKGNKSKYHRVNRFIAISRYMKKVHVEHLDIEESRFSVIPPFHDYETSGGKEISNLLPDDFILFVGALMPAKGVDVLIEAYGRLNTETRLVMIGIEYPHYKYDFLNDRVIFIRSPSRDVVLAAYSKCRYVVIPSVWPEPAGRVAFEAMTHKKAVVASGTGGLTDIIADNETGILVQPRDADALAQAMKYLLDNPQHASTMGQLGYERWEHLFTADAVIPQIEEVYQRVLT